MEGFHPTCYLLLARSVRTKCALVIALRNATSNRYVHQRRSVGSRFAKQCRFLRVCWKFLLPNVQNMGHNRGRAALASRPRERRRGASFFQESQMKPANRTEEAEQTNCSLISEGRGTERGEEERRNETWEGGRIICNIKEGSADKLIISPCRMCLCFKTMRQKCFWHIKQKSKSTLNPLL